MSEVSAPPSTEELAREHSALTQEVKALESRAQTLRLTNEDTSSIVEEFIEFAEHFADRLTGQIAEEEENLLPRCVPYLTAASVSMLHRIRRQHRQLNSSLATLREYLEMARLSPNALDVDLVEAIYARARTLRYSLALHMADEQELLEHVRS